MRSTRLRAITLRYPNALTLKFLAQARSAFFLVIQTVWRAQSRCCGLRPPRATPSYNFCSLREPMRCAQLASAYGRVGSRLRCTSGPTGATGRGSLRDQGRAILRAAKASNHFMALCAKGRSLRAIGFSLFRSFSGCIAQRLEH